MLVDTTQLKAGEEGVIVQLLGGPGLLRKMQSLGVRIGKKVKKVSSHFWHGPQTIEIDNLKIAIGYGLAKKIIVEVKR
jgi:ferrous iron transport protein A